MKFFGVGIVWDAENNKPLCEFVDGSFETEDDFVIEKLYYLGYTNEDEIKGGIIADGQSLNPNDDGGKEFIITIEGTELARMAASLKPNYEKELREKAQSLGIKSWHVKSIETLEKEIGELEKGGI